MLKHSLQDKFFSRFFDNKISIQVQVFNLLMFISITAGIYGTIIGTALIDNLYPIIASAMISLIGLSLLIAAEMSKKYQLCSRLYVVAMFFIALPMLFFASGGYRGGAFLTFGIAIVFTSILLQGAEKGAAITFELILYVSCILVAFYIPETVNDLHTEFDYVFLTVVYFLSVSGFLLAALMIFNRMLAIRQERIEELNRELTSHGNTLKQYDAMKSDFLATVAHEINTPLAVIAASSNDTLDLLSESKLNMAELKENQIIIGKRVKLIDSILLDLMDTVAIETGRLTLQRLPVSLSELIKDAGDAYYSKSALPGLPGRRIAYELQPDLPLIWVDPPRIEQVMLNLLSNAFRFTKSGTVTVKLEQANGAQTVSVTDDGEGMDAKSAQDALLQYVTTSPDHWRHGIGLYICRRIILAHDGQIWIDSEIGNGTMVAFSVKEGAPYY